MDKKAWIEQAARLFKEGRVTLPSRMPVMPSWRPDLDDASLSLRFALGELTPAEKIMVDKPLVPDCFFDAVMEQSRFNMAINEFVLNELLEDLQGASRERVMDLLESLQEMTSTSPSPSLLIEPPLE